MRKQWWYMMVMSSVLVSGIVFSGGTVAAGAKGPRKPQLVLMLTVDQLRGDMPRRFASRFGDSGFRRLMEEGVYYTNANFQHSTTFTSVGHAALATGAPAAEHGIAGNDWYDAKSGEHVYSVEDDTHELLGEPTAPHAGTSPWNLTGSSFGDELVLASGGKSRVFSVSIKDRGAILPGGHLGKAFWYSKKTGRFISSSYYYNQLPEWATSWNKQESADRYLAEKWRLMQKQASYRASDRDDRAFEKPPAKLSRTFPHTLPEEASADFYSALRYTPMGDELTVDFAKKLMQAEKLGQGDVTDVLAVSLSATDYIGHAFGPKSLEAEDNLLRVDQAIAELLAYVDDKIGLDRTLVVLASDHGVDAAPEHHHAVRRMIQPGINKKSAKESARTPSTGRLTSDELVPQLNTALKERMDIEEDLVEAFWNPSFYLDLDVVGRIDASVVDVQRVMAKSVRRLPGVARAFTRRDLMRGRVSDGPTVRKVRRAFHPDRSGHVLIVQSPFWYLYSSPKFAAMHGSPYSYDTYVPVMFAGPGVESGRVNRRIAPSDIPATIAARLGVKPPTGCTGDPLPEVLSGIR